MQRSEQIELWLFYYLQNQLFRTSPLVFVLLQAQRRDSVLRHGPGLSSAAHLQTRPTGRGRLQPAEIPTGAAAGVPGTHTEWNELGYLCFSVLLFNSSFIDMLNILFTVVL